MSQYMDVIGICDTICCSINKMNTFKLKPGSDAFDWSSYILYGILLVLKAMAGYIFRNYTKMTV